MKSIIRIMTVFFVLLACHSLHAEPGSAPEKKLKADVVLFATPIKVKALDAATPVEVLETSPENMGKASKAVLFRIDRVVRGNFKTITVPDPSVWEQAKNAAGDKSFLKLVTMDFERPSEGGTPKECFTMAVSDPLNSFGIKEGEAPSKQRYRISLARIHKDPDSYILVQSEKR